MFGFAGLDASNYTIQSLDPFNDLEENWGKGAFKRFTGLKKVNPQLKALLAIGGWNEGCTKYSQMVSTPQRRAIFIESALKMVLDHEFDGLDLDWEYPGLYYHSQCYRMVKLRHLLTNNNLSFTLSGQVFLPIA